MLRSRLLVWGLLAMPAVWMLAAWAAGATFYGEVVHDSGITAIRLLMGAMAITPLARWLPAASITRWLIRQRRYVGVAAFGYALLHASVYLARQPSIARVLEDAAAAAMWTGWLALILMTPLAATSHDAAVRWLRSRWKALHRSVYVVALASFAHWILSAFDPRSAWLHAGLLAMLELTRVWPRRPGRSGRQPV